CGKPCGKSGCFSTGYKYLLKVIHIYLQVIHRFCQVIHKRFGVFHRFSTGKNTIGGISWGSTIKK
ncbi:MAG: hypothetical protein ACK568_07530, partial [Pseudanabaena sp.]